MRFIRTPLLAVAVDDTQGGIVSLPQTVSEMIAYAKRFGRQAVPFVVTTFNSVAILVDCDSDPRLIRRDYYRTIVGDRKSRVVGPYPQPELPGLEGHSIDDMATAQFWQLHHPRGSYRGPCCQGSRR